MTAWTLAVPLAQALPPGMSEWVNLGAAGLVIVAVLLGWLVPGRVHDRVVIENTELRKSLEVLNGSIRDTYLPAILENSSALEALVHELRGGATVHVKPRLTKPRP